jgi:queuine tRNA-ribosyltransferase
VVQGGGDLNLRRQCADALLEIGFDGYGYGGWPLDRSGKLLTEVLAATRALIPPEFPMHALGVGHPDSIVACVRMGYQIFDCALPTRDARSGRLYIWNAAPDTLNFDANPRWRDTLYIEDDRHIKTDRPLSAFCDCPTCARYSVGYLRHLFKAGDTLYMRLATQHNLRFMTRLMERLRDGTD